MEKKETTETPNLKIILAIGIAAVALVVLVTFWVKKSKSNYNECIDNVPSVRWFEEMLEEVFLSLNVEVLDIDEEEPGCVVVEVSVEEPNGWSRYYRCLYKVKSYDSFNWHWELVRYV